MSIHTSGLPPYDEQKVVKVKKAAKDKYIPPMNIISQMKAKELNIANLKPRKK